LFDERNYPIWFHPGTGAVLKLLAQAYQLVLSFMLRPHGSYPFLIEIQLFLLDEIGDSGERAFLVPALIPELCEDGKQAMVHGIEATAHRPVLEASLRVVGSRLQVVLRFRDDILGKRGIRMDPLQAAMFRPFPLGLVQAPFHLIVDLPHA